MKEKEGARVCYRGRVVCMIDREREKKEQSVYGEIREV
jgi:hypothetical protein